MEKNLLKKFKKKLSLKNKHREESNINQPKIDRNSFEIINDDIESYFLKEDISNKNKIEPLNTKKPSTKKQKTTKPKKKEALKTNKNKIPVIDSKEDLISAFSNNNKYRVKSNRVKPEPKKFTLKQDKEIPALKKIDKDKNGIKILNKDQDLNSYFNLADINLKKESFKTDTSILRAKKGTKVTSQKLPLKKRLEKYPLPEKTLDLHGYTSIQAKLKTENFIKSSFKQGYFTLRIITGKGIHSLAGAVLPDITKDLVNELIEEKIVLSYKWENISKHDNSSGSMIVYLNRYDQ